MSGLELAPRRDARQGRRTVKQLVTAIPYGSGITSPVRVGYGTKFGRPRINDRHDRQMPWLTIPVFPGRRRLTDIVFDVHRSALQPRPFYRKPVTRYRQAADDPPDRVIMRTPEDRENYRPSSGSRLPTGHRTVKQPVTAIQYGSGGITIPVPVASVTKFGRPRINDRHDRQMPWPAVLVFPGLEGRAHIRFIGHNWAPLALPVFRKTMGHCREAAR